MAASRRGESGLKWRTCLRADPGIYSLYALCGRGGTQPKPGKGIAMKSGMKAKTRGKSAAGNGPKRPTPRKWSKRVMETSDALDLDQGVFSKDDPGGIARSLKRSAERSRRKKTDAFRSAMSMLNFYINRAGKNLPKSRIKVLDEAKEELRRLFGREPSA